MSSLDYLDLCRLCLVKDRVSVPIFDGEGDVRQIFLKIAACLPVKVAREDKLPKKICDDCVYKVELFYQFWNTTVNAEKQLLQWLGEVGMEGKQGYVTNVLNPNVMKQEQSTENRLDGSVMQQVSEHQNNMGIGMMDNIGLGIPMIISNTNQQQQITSVPMDTSSNSAQNVQAVPGPSSQTTHNQISQNQTSSTQQEEEEESSEDEENSDDECDGDEGLPVKEESEEDPNSRTIEPTTFVNVSLACDEAGPSGLQQQKIADMPEIPMPQTADGDPKSGGRVCDKKILTTDTSGRFIIGNDSMPMQLCQHVDPSGKLHYLLVPALNDPPKSEESTKMVAPLLSVKVEETEDQHNVQKTNDEMNRYVDSLMHLCEVAIDFFSCDKCGVKFPTESMLNRHKTSHKMTSWLCKKRLSHKQAFSVRSVSRKQNRKVQSQKPTEKRKHSCSFCDFGCSKQSALTLHVRKKHKPAVSKEVLPKITCAICSYECENQSSLRKHMKSHRDAKAMCFRCDSCDFTCKRSRTLVSHVVRNHRKIEDIEISSKKKSKMAKCNDDSSGKEDWEDTCLEESKIDIKDSIILCTPSEFECKKEPTMTTRTSKKQSKKPAEELCCNLCDFRCSEKRALYSHKRQHKDDTEVYSCNECTFKTTKKSSLYSHINRKHRVTRHCTADGLPKLFYCNQCDYKNKNKYELKVHAARKHTDDFKFSCETCGKKFKVKGDLTNHIRFSHKEQPVICDVCGKTCSNSNSLYVHQKFAHYKAKYECQVCKRRMVTQENLNEHMIKQHEKRENVVCEECGKTFSRNSRLKVHMRIHTGDKPYTCTICNKSFARRTALKQHLLIHTGIRPYVCDICGKAFTQKPGLISHRKSHPGSHPPLPKVFIDHILNDVMNN
ncbi:zinc finger protein 665-like isoform X3 [Colletes gigas]|uniref:zinc finger protein 665-like isoform X3 n=1 Tax=Colletes gigas TaxID=935657 RepID=UPI001C9B2318|nr:zinc finger protein 665-like isoform X3 [Colletes gigas]